MLDLGRVRRIELLLKTLRMPHGLHAHEPLDKALTGYQWLFITAILCVVYRSDPKRRRYENAILEIARKNFKTFTIATVFILLLMLEPANARFYSVAPDGSLSREVKAAIEDILRSSPLAYEWKDTKRFDLLYNRTVFKPNRNTYYPLNYSTNRMDGKLPSVFLADEVGALPSAYAIEAMRSGQTTILNKLGCIISTKYPTIDNPFEDEVRYAKLVLDGIEPDDSTFALLYEPDKTKNWMTDDLILQHANPVAQEIPAIWESLLKRRSRAIVQESARENFLTKHCNIIYQGKNSESFIDMAAVQKCRVEKIDWSGRNVYVGVDLSMSHDNTSVSFVAEDEGHILAESVAFIPEGRIEEKNKTERIDYRRFIDELKAIACGDLTIDYSVVEQWVLDIEEAYGVTIMGIGYDKWNAMSSAQKWANHYNVLEVRQHSDTLHPATKLLFEAITNGNFEYEKNSLLEINFQNAKVTYDTNMNRYINKKRSAAKVDMVVSLLNAIVLLQKDVLLDGSEGFVVQVG